MKFSTLAIAFTAIAPALATPAPFTPDEDLQAKYTTVCPYKFCFKRPFSYKCNDKGKMKKEKSFEGCRIGCYCRKKSLMEVGEDDEIVEEMNLGHEFEGLELLD